MMISEYKSYELRIRYSEGVVIGECPALKCKCYMSTVEEAEDFVKQVIDSYLKYVNKDSE